MRFYDIYTLIKDTLDLILVKNCQGCYYKLENQLAHSCLYIDQWEYFDLAVDLLKEKGDISTYEASCLELLNNGVDVVDNRDNF